MAGSGTLKQGITQAAKAIVKAITKGNEGSRRPFTETIQANTGVVSRDMTREASLKHPVFNLVM